MNFCMSSKIKNIFSYNTVQSVSFHYSHEWIYLFDRKPSFEKQSHQLFIYMIKCSTSTKKCHVKFQICNRSGRAPIASKIKVHIQHIANHCKEKVYFDKIYKWQSCLFSYLINDQKLCNEFFTLWLKIRRFTHP